MKLVMDRLSFTLSHITAVVQCCLTELFKRVSVATVSERLDDLTTVKCATSPQPSDNLLRLSKESSLVEAWPNASLRFFL